jgi:hypothetical protein
LVNPKGAAVLTFAIPAVLHLKSFVLTYTSVLANIRSKSRQKYLFIAIGQDKAHPMANIRNKTTTTTIIPTRKGLGIGKSGKPKGKGHCHQLGLDPPILLARIFHQATNVLLIRPPTLTTVLVVLPPRLTLTLVLLLLLAQSAL